MSDPFYIVKDELLTSLKQADQLLAQYAQTGLAQSANELDSCMQGIYIDLDDLKESVRAVEGNPGKFGLTIADLKMRRKFIEDTQARADAVRKAFVEKKAEVDRAALFRTPQRHVSDGQQKQQPATNTTNAQFIASEKQQQTQLMRQQDDQLDQVTSTVVTLKQVASVMERELEDQSKLLEEMEIQVDTTQDKLSAGLKRVNTFLKDNASTFCVQLD